MRRFAAILVIGLIFACGSFACRDRNVAAPSSAPATPATATAMEDKAILPPDRHGGHVAKLPGQGGEVEWLTVEHPSRLRCFVLDTDRHPLPVRRILWVHDGPDHPEVHELNPCMDAGSAPGCWEVALPQGRTAGDTDLLRIETESAGYRIRLGQSSSS